MGYGRYIAVRAVNAFAVLLVALLIASTAFNALHEKQLWSEIYE
ncbi:MAG: ABC transporter permease, partial [Thermoprotei archaeon]